MKILLKIILFCLVLFTTFSCAKAQNKIQFSLPKLLDEFDNSDSTIQFVKSCLVKDFTKCKEIFPDIVAMEVSPFIRKVGDFEPFLIGLGDFFIEYYYAKNNRLLPAIIFLKFRYLLRNDSYSAVLSDIINYEISDKQTILALYMLAELRYNYKYDLNAKYIVEQLYRKFPQNLEIQRIYNQFKVVEGDVPDIELQEFLKKEVRYFDELKR